MPTTLSTFGFVADPGSVRNSTGRQFDWASIATSFQNADLVKTIPAGTVVSLQGDGKLVPRSNTIAATSLTDDGASEVTAVVTAHGFATGDTVAITGAVEARFNGSFTVTVTDANTFTYVPLTTSAAAATGTPVCNYEAWGVLTSTAREAAPEHARSGYGVYKSAHLFENCLPDATGTPKVLPAVYKTELAGNGGSFSFEQYEDSRLT